ARFDLADTLARKGYDLHFAELHFVIGIWTDEPDEPGFVQFRMCMPGREAIVPSLPLIRTAGMARSSLLVSAVIVGREGNLLRKGEALLRARVGNHDTILDEEKGVWSGYLPALPAGEHCVVFEKDGEPPVKSRVVPRVTSEEFYGYDPTRKSCVRDGQVTGPLSGSYQGMVFFAEAGLAHEHIVQGQEQWQTWDRSAPSGEHWHYWEALTERELEERFIFLANNGWNVLHLCQHWGQWEKLDAGGRIAPHGAEQLALVLRVAARHGLALLQALSHYPYGGDYTSPYRAYSNAGYQAEDWQKPRDGSGKPTVFTRMFHGYLKDFAALFREETSLFGMSTSGEGDIKAGPERVNDTFDYMSSQDGNHLFLGEPIHRLSKLPLEHAEGWSPPLSGGRLYWIGEECFPELDLGIEFKFLQMGHFFMGEGSWPCPHLYADFMGFKTTWAGTARYRIRVRDSLYLGLVHRIPLLLTWEEQYTEDEHRMLNEIRRQVNWRQPFEPAPIALIVNAGNARQGGRKLLEQYEHFFSRLPIPGRYVTLEESKSLDAALVLDARMSYQEMAWSSQGGIVPDSLKSAIPISVSAPYRCTWVISRDRRTLLAYIYNCADSDEVESDSPLCGRLHRNPQPKDLRIDLGNLPDGELKCRVYDLSGKRLAHEEWIRRSAIYEFAETDRDFFVLITP
ncbi:hypothetical protein HQ520_15790, partial [bacterium]|nr:hypothetical protein [bacterium]